MRTRTTRVLGMLLLIASTSGMSAQLTSLSTQPTASTSTSAGTHMMFDLITNTNDVMIHELDHRTTGTPTTMNLYYKVGTWVGSESNIGAWTLHATVNVSPPVSSFVKVVLPTPLVIPANSIYGIAIGSPQTSPSYNSSVSATGYQDSNLHISPPWRASTGPFVGGLQPREWCGTIWYTAQPPGPTLTVDVTTGTRELVAANEQGPGSNGVEAGRFTITSNSISSSSLQEIKVKAAGTGNDATGFTLVSIYRDADASGSYSGNDSLVGSIVSFPSDNGTATITVATAEQGFGLSETRLYFIVVRMSGTGLGTETFDFIVEDLTIPTQNFKSGVPSQTIQGVQIDAPTLTVAATAGTTQQVLRDAQGPGNNGIQLGVFTISSGALTGGTLTSIVVTPSGTLNDVSDFSEIAVYRETNATAGFQPTDTLIQSHSGFPADDTARAFAVSAPQQVFGATEVRTYYLVGKLSGSAAISTTFNSEVTNLTVTGTFVAGVPSTTMNGLSIDGPTLTVTATAGSAQAVFADEQGPGGNGIQVGTFTIACDNFSNAVLNEILLLPSGSMDDSTDFSEVAIYRESNATAGYQVGDTLIQTHTSFPANDTALIFTVPVPQGTFAANETRTYYVVVRLSGNAVITTTFLSEVEDLTVSGSLKAGVPSTAMNGLSIDRPTFILNDFSPTAQQTVSPGATDVVMQAFDASYPAGPSESLTLLAVRGAGTGNDAVDVTSVRLVLDANSDRLLDAGDSVLGTLVYTLDNGLCSFDISGQAAFTPPETRSYLVVYDFSPNATDQATFGCFLHVADASTAGTMFLGLPLPNTNGTPGVVINANRLLVNLVGPAAAQTVDSNDLGPTGDGLLLADVTIQAPPTHSWTLTDLTFVASGSGSHATAYSEIAVYDDDGNGVWDGAGTDTLAAPATVAFNAGTNDVTFTLTNAALAQGQTRRFLLVGKLNGTAVSGQTFNARLEAMTATSALPGQVITLPTADSTALMIDDAVITVGSGPKPPNVLRMAGQAAQLPMALFRFTATNDSVDVNSLTLTTAGTGDWINDMDPTTGIQLYLDDGDGVFSATSDALLGQAAGAASVQLTPSPTLTVGNGSSEDVWVVVNLLATGGTGASAAADTYTFSITGAGNVSVSGSGPVTVLVSTAAPPTSATLSVIDFFVTDFQPPESLLAGGDVITMTGSGFIAPVTVRIDGVLCPGTAVISGGGTQLTGIMVPPRTSVGSGLAIEVTSGGLPAQVLTQTFRYTVKDEGGGASSDDGGGCTGTHSTWALLAGIASLLAVAALRRRRLA